MRIVIGSDHRGLEFKQTVITLIAQMGHETEDAGSFTEEPVDYPDIAQAVAEGVTGGNYDYGILICNTGIGMSIAANKLKGIRAALCLDAFSAARARQHNDANILCLAAMIDDEMLPGIVSAFLTSKFEGGRHQRRLDKIKTLEDRG
jgi:ribose 5-phosphate isomerase B